MADVKIGDKAPDFELRDTTKQPMRLSDYAGKKAVVLVFFPFAFSGTCTSELCTIRDGLENFQNDEVQTIAVSADSPFANGAFAEKEGLDFPVLSDYWPHGATARAYGVLNEAVGAAERATFVIDKDGTVVYSVHNNLGEARDADAYTEALRSIGAI